MISRLMGLVFALPALLLAAAAVASDSVDLPALVQKSSPSIVMIEAVNVNGRSVRGAGFVFDAKGQIATAFHVVDSATSIHLTYFDGRKAKARIASYDAPFDLALLIADVSAAAPPLSISTQEPPVGASVVAIGNPFGHAFSVSAGIVSGHDRTYDQLTPHGFLQHDAALNPGNSGGPVLDAKGNVAGINAAIPNGRRTDVGVGFAIPGKIIARILAALDRDGVVRHGYLGARLRLLDHALAAAMNRSAGGAAIEEIEPAGPAQRAGLRVGDIILSIDGRTIDSLRQVSESVIGGAPGSKLSLIGLRDGEPLQLMIELGSMPSSPGMMSARQDKLSLRVPGIDFPANGSAVVKTIAAGSPAAAAGMKKGDRILSVGGQTVATAGEARSALALVTTSALALLVHRESVGARYVILSDSSMGTAGSPLAGNREAEGSLPF